MKFFSGGAGFGAILGFLVGLGGNLGGVVIANPLWTISHNILIYILPTVLYIVNVYPLINYLKDYSIAFFA